MNQMLSQFQRSFLPTLTAITFTLSLGACGSDDDGQVDVMPPVVSVTSHSDGQTITGSRAITVEWSVVDGSPVSNKLTLNGTDQTIIANADGTYSASISLKDRDNSVVVEAFDASFNKTSVTLNLNYPFLALANGQAASVVIGQPDFESFDQGAGANMLRYPYGNPAVYNGILYLPDTSNHRVLGFNAIPTANNASADFVLGQPNFVTTTGGTSDVTFTYPETVVISDGKMFMTDSGNHRVLIWNSVPTSTGVKADVVVGQSVFDASTFGCTQDNLYYPESIHVVDGKLIVGDSSNNRVLVWNSIPTTNGAAVDLVLGQAGFTSCEANRIEAGAVAADTLSRPAGVWSDGQRLVVADASNNRVLVWNSFPTSNGQAADVVLGQPDMVTTNWSVTSAKDFAYPYFLYSNGNQLFVADHVNNRILVWDAIPTTSYAPADRVLGQVDFTGNTTGTSATQLKDPEGVFAYDNKLIVGDISNHRYLIFEAQ